MNKSSGFTLIELLITIVVIGLTVASLSDIFISINNVQKQAADLDGATRAAQAEIETLRNDNYGSLTPGQNITFTSNLPSTLPKGSSGTAVVSQPATDLRRVDATVTYPLEGTTHSVTLSSLIGVIGITQ